MSANPNNQPSKKIDYVKWGFVLTVISTLLAALALVPKNPTQEVTQKPTTQISQAEETLRLLVKDEQGNPLKGVQIAVDSSVIPPDAFPFTNSDGYTSIALPDGVKRFRVVASKKGYLPEEKNIDLNIKLDTNRTIKLTKEQSEATSTTPNIPTPQSNLVPSKTVKVVAATSSPKVENANGNIQITSHQANQLVSYLQEINGTFENWFLRT